MKKVLVAAVGLMAAAAPAFAADLPARTYAKAPATVAHVYDWSGFYIGLNGGGASSHECLTITSVAGTAVVPNSEGCHNATGGLVGGQIGYRWQTANWVFGVEGQGDWAGLKGSNSSLTALIPYMNQTRVDAIDLFTGQVGYTWNNALVYLKGGAAVTDNHYSSFFPVSNGFAAAGVPFNAASDTRWGGAVGTGIEIGLAPNWSVAVEYDHLFMGTPNVTFPQSNIAVTRSDNIRQDVDMGTVRVNYRFGGPVVAKY
ncbi:OmpA-like transmembrane domain protein [mine drainage metagenome]|uniref:OmpA-like transmembrane domain protein n=1 Tax=mine drainage metagenome TaxID=410659 RepID=A0A1J5PUJ9_9ZZZZ